VAHSLMLVDDSPAVHRLVEQAAQDEGFATAWFKDGSSALAAAGQTAPSVIVAEFGVAGTTFISFCERLAGLELQPTPPIIALISPGDRFDEAELRFLGVKAFLQKPLQRNDVLQAVKQIATALGQPAAAPSGGKPKAASPPPTPAKAAPAAPASPGAPPETIVRELEQRLPGLLRDLLPEQIQKAYPREDMILIAIEAVQQAIPDIAAQLVADITPLVQRQVAETTARLVKESLESHKPGTTGS
jgi:CheY-like chemotaxis protein